MKYTCHNIRLQLNIEEGVIYFLFDTSDSRLNLKLLPTDTHTCTHTDIESVGLIFRRLNLKPRKELEIYKAENGV